MALKPLKQEEYPLKIVEDLGTRCPTAKSKQKKRFASFECICGKVFEADVYSIKTRPNANCGCNRKGNNSTHGDSNTRLYKIWLAMKDRCYNKRSHNYKYYGGIGVTVYDPWLKNYLSFKEWSLTNGYKENLSIDKDLLSHKLNIHPPRYSPETCMWATVSEQVRTDRVLAKNNTSGYRGVVRNRSGNWYAQIGIGKSSQKWLGVYTTALEAAKAYDMYILENNLEHTPNGVLDE